jgi:outer membrane protein assembly factor BamB
MKSKISLLSLFLILLAAALSACGGSYYGSTSWPGLAANDQLVFVANNPHIYAVNLVDGTEAWRFPEKASARTTFFADPVLTPDGQLLAASYDKNLYSLDPTNGTQNWVFSGAKDLLIASPLVTEQGIFQVSADGNLYALDFEGNQVWMFETGGPVWARPTAEADCSCLFVASMDHSVYAVNAVTGELIWKSADLDGAIVGSPAFDPNGSLIVGTFGSEIISLDGETGAINWRIPTEGWVWSGGVYNQGAFYIGDLQGYFYSLDATTGTQNWRIQPGGSIIGSPLLLGDRLYISTENDTVFVVNNTGEILDSQVVSGTLYSSPYAAGDLILIAPINSDILLAAITPTGAQQWTYLPAK